VRKVNSGVGAGDERREVLQLKGDREDVRTGRRFLAQTLIRFGWDDRVDDASLMLSELLANVALHARTACSVLVSANEGLLRVEVEDGSPILPRIQHFSIDTTTGRGLRLVERLAKSWGVERTAAGKAIWFCLEHAGVEERLGAASETFAAAETLDITDLDVLLQRLGGSEEDGSPSLFSSLVTVG
jgi:anti-sigma regulatory factor (Ser/Thr protein kinase)